MGHRGLRAKATRVVADVLIDLPGTFHVKLLGLDGSMNRRAAGGCTWNIRRASE